MHASRTSPTSIKRVRLSALDDLWAWLDRQGRDPDGHVRPWDAHMMVAVAVRKGWLVRGSCEVCGAVPAEGHHDDYDKPLDVRWLCSLHHAGRHVQLRSVASGARIGRMTMRSFVDAGGRVDEPTVILRRGPDGLSEKLGVMVPDWLWEWDEL